MNLKSFLFLSTFSSLIMSCVPEAPTKPENALDNMVKGYGYIGFQNPLEMATTGTMIGGRPSAVSFVAPAKNCFPENMLERFYDRSEITKVFNYKYQGNLGFLASGNPIVSAGLGIKSDITVNIELSNLIMEYMSSIDITEWYLDGMSQTCKDYLDQVGFIIQGLKAEKLKISLKKLSGVDIGLNADNISQYFQFQTGVSWEIVDEFHVEITTPKYIGYQLGRLRLEDNGRTLWRAMSIKDDKYVFEPIELFNDDDVQQKSLKNTVNKSLQIDQNAIYQD